MTLTGCAGFNCNSCPYRDCPLIPTITGTACLGNTGYDNGEEYVDIVFTKQKVPLIKEENKIQVKEIRAERRFQHKYIRGGRRK